MVKEIDISVNIKTTKAVEEVEKLNNELDNTKKNNEEIGGGGSKAFAAMGKAGSAAFSAVGTAIKAAGIGLLIGVLGLLMEAFKKNQKVVDLLSTAINVIGQFINGFIKSITSMIKKVSDSTGGFEALKLVLINMIKMGLTPLRLAFESIALLIHEIQLAWEQSVFGGKDQDKINDLTKKIQENKDSIVKLGTECAESAKIIAANTGAALNQVGQLANGVVDAVKDAVNNTSIEAAAAATEAVKQFERLEKVRQRIQTQGEMDAEIQRQIRDNTSLTLEERIAANDKIAAILAKQSNDEKNAINGQIAAINTRIKVEGKSEELENELLDLKNKRLEVESRIIGQMSEQKANQVSLLDEQKTASEEEIANITEANETKIKLQKEQSQTEAALAEQTRMDNLEYNEEMRDEDLDLQEEQFEEDLEKKLEREEITQEQFNELKQNLENKYNKIRAKTTKAANNAILYDEKTQLDKRTATKELWIDTLTTLLGKESGIAKGIMLLNQAQTIATIVANTASANSEAVAMSTTTAGMPWVGINTAYAVANIANVIATTGKQLGAFEDGGIVGGTSYTGDKQLVRINSGELIMNQNQQEGLWNFIKSGSNNGGNNQDITTSIVNAIKQIPVVVSEQDITTMQKKNKNT